MGGGQRNRHGALRVLVQPDLYRDRFAFVHLVGRPAEGDHDGHHSYPQRGLAGQCLRIAGVVNERYPHQDMVGGVRVGQPVAEGVRARDFRFRPAHLPYPLVVVADAG